MPPHRQITYCLREGGPISKFCTCQHCTLAVCSVCNAYEGSLTTDCPEEQVNFDRQKEVYETNLDYTDARGWHQGEPMKRRAPNWQRDEPPKSVPPEDQRSVVTPLANWTTVDRLATLQDVLSQKAIAWALADRICDDHSATLARLEKEIDVRLRQDQEPNEEERALLSKLEYAKIGFQLACRRVEKCDDELRQAARMLVDALEKK